MGENSLVRKLSFWHIWALGVGSVVGDGIFLLVAQGAGVAGPSAAVSYLVAGLLIMVVCMSISEMAVGMPGAGSLHTWSSRILGPVYGTVAGLSEIAMNIIFLGSVGLAAGALSNYFYQWTASAQTSAVIWALILVTIVLAISLSGGEVTGRAQLILVVILASIMVGFAVTGVVSGRIDPANYKPFAPFGIKGMWAAMGMGIYAYMGPLSLLTAGSEVKNITDLPKAMFWAFITFLILYTSAMVVMLGLVKYTGYASLESPYVTAASFMFGNAAGLIINTAAWIAAFTCLIGEIFASSRLLFGMAQEHVVPSIFGKVSKKTRVPYVGLIFSYVIAIGIIALGSIGALEGVYLEICIVGSVVGTVCFFISLISSVKYKNKFNEEWKGLPWHLPARNILHPVAFLGVAALFYALFSSSPRSIITSAVVIGLMVVFYYTYSVKNVARNKG